MLLALFLALSLALSGASSKTSALPPTQPGLGPDEGVFMRTTADDGSRVVYFIARGARHSVLEADLQTELTLNPLWPVRSVDPEVALVYPEAIPVGAAKVGLMQSPSRWEEVVADAPEPAEADSAQPAIEPTTYTLRRGDNLTHISRAHGTTVEAILQANGISDANRIYAGQTLMIPGA